MDPFSVRRSQGRFHLAVAIALAVGAFLLMIDPHDASVAFVPFVLVPLAVALYALVHWKATTGVRR